MTAQRPASEECRRATKDRGHFIESSSFLDQIREPALLLDTDARVVSGNEAGVNFLGGSQGLCCVGGKLRGLNEETASILQAVADVAQTNETLLPFRTVKLASSPGYASLVMLLVRWKDPIPRTGSKAAQVLAMLQVNALETVHHADRFGFTSTEAALAADLMAGLRLKDVATRRGRRISTIRTQLARLMSKTGTTRQAELISLLLRSHGAKLEPVSGQWTGATGRHALAARVAPTAPGFIHLNDNEQGTVRMRNVTVAASSPAAATAAKAIARPIDSAS